MPLVVASEAVERWCLDRVEMMQNSQTDSGFNTGFNAFRCLRGGLLDFGYIDWGQQRFLCYTFKAIDYQFYEEFCTDNDEVRYWVDVKTRDERGDVISTNAVEVFHKTTAPSLVELCKKFIREKMDVSLEQLIKMKEIVPEIP